MFMFMITNTILCVCVCVFIDLDQILSTGTFPCDPDLESRAQGHIATD